MKKESMVKESKKDNVYMIPTALAQRLKRVAEAKKRYNDNLEKVTNESCVGYREWDNAGYSIYNDRG